MEMQPQQPIQENDIETVVVDVVHDEDNKEEEGQTPKTKSKRELIIHGAARGWKFEISYYDVVGEATRNA